MNDRAKCCYSWTIIERYRTNIYLLMAKHMPYKVKIGTIRAIIEDYWAVVRD